MARINDAVVTSTTIYDPVKYMSNGTDTKEIESIGILIGDKSATGDRLGSTNVVAVNSDSNVNLQSEKNVLIKAKKAKLVFDTTNSITNGKGNEMLIITKVKENVNDATNGYYKTEVDNGYCGDHGDVIMEQRRLRIKPFNVPTWSATDASTTSPSIATAQAKTKTEGYIYLDVAGLEAADSGGAGYPDNASSESTMEIRVGNHDTSTDTLATAEYRPLTLKTRGIDLRCMTHGGIAIQPCGYDEPNQTIHHENKIKFESSRIKDIYSDDVKTDAEGNLYIDNTKTGYIYTTSGTSPKDKWVKGGDGLEFGTFNNLHTSLYTRDYRFNAEAPVYAVSREIIYEDADEKEYELQADGYHLITAGTAATSAASPQPTIVKADYKTQDDDFKDKISSDLDKATTVKDIVKTAYAFNSGKDRHAKVTSSGSLEIQTNETFHWVETTGTVDEQTVIPTAFADLTAIYNDGDGDLPTTGAVYQSGGKLYVWTQITSPEIKIESGSDVTIQSDTDDVVLDANDVVKASGDEIRLTADTMISLSTTPKVVCLSLKFKKSATFEDVDTLITTGFLNNTSGNVFRATDGTVKVPTENIYTDSSCTTLVTADTAAETAIYHLVEGVPTACEKDSKYFMMIGETAYQIATKSKSAVIKSNGITICDASTNPGVTFVASTYTAAEGETVVASGDVAEGALSCSVADIITLVNYFKTGAGKANGPWAE